MKKSHYKILSVLAAVMLLSMPSRAGTEQAVRQYDSSQLSISSTEASDGNRYTTIRWEGLSTTAEVGAPELPVEYIRFLVPVYTNNFTAATDVVTRPMAQRLLDPVMPVQAPVSTNHTGPVEFTSPDATSYSVDYDFRAEVVEDGFIDGCNHIVTVAVYPVSYSPKERSYTIAESITVSLSYDNCSLTELEHTPIFPPHRSKYLDLNTLVVNQERANNRNYAPTKKAPQYSTDYYYIITPRNLKNAFEDLAVWKRQKGYNVIIKCIEDIYEDERYKIGNTYRYDDSVSEQVLDSAMSLRCYLRDQFKLKGQFFCLLAGDWRTPMPIRKAGGFSNGYNSKKINTDYYNNCEYYTPTDIYFVNLTNNYELLTKKNLTIYLVNQSKMNYMSDIFVGRLLCATPIEVNNYLNKLIIYESNPGYGDNDYLEKAFHVESCDKHWNENSGKYIDGTCLIGSTENIVNNLKEMYELYFIQDDAHVHIYGNSENSLSPYSHRPEDELGPTADEFIKRISNSGFISYMSHGSPYGFLVGGNGYIVYSGDDMIGQFPYNDPSYLKVPNSGLNNLKNIDKPFFAYSLSCKNAPFDAYMDKWGNMEQPYAYVHPNLGRAFTTESQMGAVGGVWNTRDGYVTGSPKIETEFLKSIINTPKVSVGFYNAKYNVANESSSKLSANLIGDPEYELWLGKPKNFNATIDSGINGFEVNGVLPDSTLVSFYNGVSTILKTCDIQTTNPITNATESGDYCVSFWKTGYLPYIMLFALNGILKSEKHYIVRDAILGNNSTPDTKFTVDNGGKLVVRAIDNASVTSGFEVADGGEVELTCDRNININGGIIRKGGKLIVRAKNVKFGNGFKVMPGGILEIRNK